MVSCSTDNENQLATEAQLTRKSKSYNLPALKSANVSGTGTFLEYDDNSIKIKLELQNTIAGSFLPAHIHLNTTAEGGEIKKTLNPIWDITGTSRINIKTKDDGSTINYDAL